MPTLVKCGRKYINLDHVNMIRPEPYFRSYCESKEVRVFFTNSESYASILVSDEDFKEFEASLAKYTS